MKIMEVAAVLPVSNYDVALHYFVQVLGFAEMFRYGSYGGIKRDGCLIHLSSQFNPDTSKAGTAILYVVCDEVDAFHDHVAAKDAAIGWKPRDQPYGMRDFMTQDPDGNTLYFGQFLKKD